MVFNANTRPNVNIYSEATTPNALVACNVKPADAALIEAAPEMYLALSAVEKWCHQGHGAYPAAQCGLCKPVVAALALARGGR